MTDKRGWENARAIFWPTVSRRDKYVKIVARRVSGEENRTQTYFPAQVLSRDLLSIHEFFTDRHRSERQYTPDTQAAPDAVVAVKLTQPTFD